MSGIMPASNFDHTVGLPSPVLYRGAVTQAMALPESPTPSTRAPRRGSYDRASGSVAKLLVSVTNT